ncbi:MAG: glycosyltransferase family 2 protein [Gammaproteobacteria bacterium]|nr:glycosyltransferase family 2 protein [Gammaproteobacteria bacterium]
MLILFLLAVAFCVYTYAIFPLLLHYKARHRTEASLILPPDLPIVSIVIAAHNEESNLATKFKTISELSYPADRLEIVIVSDGSTDATVKMLEAQQKLDARFRYSHYEPAKGKPSALNCGVAMATGDYIVFMDARQRVSNDAIENLIAALQPDDVGAVSGELMLDASGGESNDVGLYWRYEKWIRLNESRLFSTTGATGALYAIARQDFEPHAEDVLLDDFNTPVSLLRHGKRTLFVPQAQVFDRAESDAGGEFHRKARTLAGNYQSFSRHLWLFAPTKNPVWWQFISHKVFRLLIPYALLIAFIASYVGNGWFLSLMFIVQLIFYVIGGLSMLNLITAENKLINFIKVFLSLNAAAVVGALRYFSGRAEVRWKRT